MQDSVRFWDKHAPGYVARPMRDVASYEKAMARVRSYLSSEHEVLEIGCGSGSTALLLAPHVKHITASDISGKMIEFGREKAVKQGIQNVSFVHSGAQEDALQSQSYDVVMGFNVVHLLPDAGAAIEQFHNQLKPGGLLITKTPCVGDVAFYWRWLIKLAQLVGYAPFVRFFKQDELARLMESKGFSVIETGNYPASPMGRFIVARKV